jgi:hypothetical protein
VPTKSVYFHRQGQVLGVEMNAKRFTGQVGVEWPNCSDRLGTGTCSAALSMLQQYDHSVIEEKMECFVEGSLESDYKY